MRASEMCTLYNKVDTAGETDESKGGGEGRGERRIRTNGRLQVQPVYIYTSPGQRILRGLCADARARAYTTDRAKPINFPFNSPNPSSAPSRLL